MLFVFFFFLRYAAAYLPHRRVARVLALVHRVPLLLLQLLFQEYLLELRVVQQLAQLGLFLAQLVDLRLELSRFFQHFRIFFGHLLLQPVRVYLQLLLDSNVLADLGLVPLQHLLQILVVGVRRHLVVLHCRLVVRAGRLAHAVVRGRGALGLRGRARQVESGLHGGDEDLEHFVEAVEVLFQRVAGVKNVLELIEDFFVNVELLEALDQQIEEVLDVLFDGLDVVVLLVRFVGRAAANGFGFRQFD